MASHDRPPSRGHSGSEGARPGPQEDTLRSETVHIERKTFLFALKENPRGRFLRITEGVGNRRDTIIVPAPGLEEFKRALEVMMKAAADTPAAQQP